MGDERKQFTFYRSYYTALKQLNQRDRAQVLMAICAYALDGEAPALSGVSAAIFDLIRPTLDSGERKAMNRLGKTKAKQTENKPETSGEQSDKEREKESESEGEKEEKEKRKRKNFVPPSVEEVSAYCRERGNSVDPNAFVDFYTSKGWMVGKTGMKDWRAAVRTWERSRSTSAAPEEPARPSRHWVPTGPFEGYWEED